MATTPTWPGGKSVAVSLTFDVDAEAGWLGEGAEYARRLTILSEARYGVTRGVPRILDLRTRGVDIAVLLDSVAQAEAVAAAAEDAGEPVPALIEIDSDGHRGGLVPGDPQIFTVAAALGANLRGVLTHAGESYFAIGREAQAAAAEGERAAVVRSAETLREALRAADGHVAAALQ